MNSIIIFIIVLIILGLSLLIQQSLVCSENFQDVIPDKIRWDLSKCYSYECFENKYNNCINWCENNNSNTGKTLGCIQKCEDYIMTPIRSLNTNYQIFDYAAPLLQKYSLIQ